MNEIKVTIYCLTYNHRDYIKDALDGFLKQKTTFGYKVLVFDDASTDGTSEILLDYQQKYPEIFQVYVSPVNTYGKPERRIVLNELYDKYLQGEYVALCEGDDAWIDCEKLQIQIDYMEKHPNCMMTTHAFKRIDYSIGKEKKVTFGENNRLLSPREIILLPNGNLATASLVMRKKVFLRNNGFPTCDVEDRPMQLNAIFYGDIYYINREMSLYRYMHEGSWTSHSAVNIENAFVHKIKFAEFLLEYDVYSKQRYSEWIWENILSYLYAAVMDLCMLENPRSVIYNRDFKENFNMEQVYEWMSGTHIMNTEELQHIKSFKKICIMGKGRYSQYIKDILKKNNIEYEGFLLSKKENECDHQTWSVAEYPHDERGTLVIVGISQVHEKEIVEILKKNNFTNVMTPLWFWRKTIEHESNY